MISTVSGKWGERETNGEDPGNQLAYLRSLRDKEDGENCRKKLRLSKDQSAMLEECFREHSKLNPKQKLSLAKQLGLGQGKLKTKLEQTEVDCEFLNRCCENLTEENMMVQKEVRELSSLRLSPQFYMRLSLPTTLTMCPSCEYLLIPRDPTSLIGDVRCNILTPVP